MTLGSSPQISHLGRPLGQTFRTALVYLHSQAGGDFFSDVPFAWTAGELRQAGLAADLVHVWLDRQDPAGSARLLDQLVELLGRYDLCVLDQVWDAAMVRRLQLEARVRIAVTDPHTVWRDAAPDFVVHHYVNHRQPLADLVAALAQQQDVEHIANVTRGSSQATKPVVEVPFSPIAVDQVAFCPLVEAIHIGRAIDRQGLPPPVRKSLDTNSGCPFSAPVEQNPAFAGVDLSNPVVNRKGCSFCVLGGDYRALTVDRTVAEHVRQLAYWQSQLPTKSDGSPGLDEVVLRDQSALRYLPQLVEQAQRAGLAPVGLLVPGRGDAILRWRDELEATAQACARWGAWFTIHLIGFESFSQPQLDLYNKHVSVEQYAQALEQMRSLAGRYDSFRLAAYGASSFILFNPWTTLEDLEATSQFVRDHAVADLAHGLTLTRLRLYPNLPLYWKAQAEGLLVDGPAARDRGAAFTGYSAEAAWRYRDPDLAIVEELQTRLSRHCGVDHSVGMLEAVVSWSRARLDQGKAPAQTETSTLDAIETELLELKRRWAPAKTANPAPPDPTSARSTTVRPTAQDRTVRLGASCNNRCRTCVAGHGRFEVDGQRLRSQVKSAVERTGRVALSGREPTLYPKLLGLIRQAHQDGAERIELVSNGRVLAVADNAAKLARSGLQALVLKRHRLADSDEDQFVQVAGAGAQTWRAAQAAVQAQLSWTLLIVPARGGAADVLPLVETGRRLGAKGIQIQVLAGELDLDRLSELTEAIDQAVQRASELGLRVGVQGF